VLLVLLLEVLFLLVTVRKRLTLGYMEKEECYWKCYSDCYNLFSSKHFLQETLVKTECYWKCYSYGDDLIPIFEFTDDLRNRYFEANSLEIYCILCGSHQVRQGFTDVFLSSSLTRGSGGYLTTFKLTTYKLNIYKLTTYKWTSYKLTTSQNDHRQIHHQLKFLKTHFVTFLQYGIGG